MPVPDLTGPLDEFVERLNDVRRIICAVEASYRSPKALTTARPGIDLSLVAATTSNNANSMALVFLASSYEEFVRQEISECANYLCTKYRSLPDAVRHNVRKSYWSTTLQKLSFSKSILTKTPPSVPDVTVLTKIRLMLESAQLFVVGDDPTRLDASTAVHHSNNFRPAIVDEIAGRVGIQNLVGRTAEGRKVRVYFGVSTSKEAAKSLRLKLDEFYSRRNEIVHSLSSTSGYGVDVLLDWINFFEIVADSMKDAMSREVAAW